MLDRRMLFIVYITLNSNFAIKIFDLLTRTGSLRIKLSATAIRLICDFFS